MPSNVLKSTTMDTFNDNAPALDGNRILQSLQFGTETRAKTGDYTIKASESGVMFTSEGAGADIEFTLPAVDGLSGFNCWVYAAEDYETLVTAPNDTLIAFNNATADGVSFTTPGNQVGCGFQFICDGTFWLALGYRGDTGATITVISA